MGRDKHGLLAIGLALESCSAIYLGLHLHLGWARRTFQCRYNHHGHHNNNIIIRFERLFHWMPHSMLYTLYGPFMWIFFRSVQYVPTFHVYLPLYISLFHMFVGIYTIQAIWRIAFETICHVRGLVWYVGVEITSPTVTYLVFFDRYNYHNGPALTHTFIQMGNNLIQWLTDQKQNWSTTIHLRLDFGKRSPLKSMRRKRRWS